MDINYIREFDVLARICNYGRAADVLYISQSSLFNHIKILESELGVPLFQRSGKVIVLSEYGQMFLDYVRIIIDAMDSYTQDIAEKKQNANKAVLIGTQYHITDLIKEFKTRQSNYVLYTMDSDNVEESLYKHGCELVFVRDLQDTEDKFHKMPYVEDSMAAVLYLSHPFADKESIKVQELKKEDFVMISPRSNKESLGYSLCKEAGFMPKVVMTSMTGSDAAKLVNDEFGVSILLKKTVISENLDNVTVVDFDPRVDCNVSICWRKDIPLSEGARKLLDFVKNRNVDSGSSV